VKDWLPQAKEYEFGNSKRWLWIRFSQNRDTPRMNIFNKAPMAHTSTAATSWRKAPKARPNPSPGQSEATPWVQRKKRLKSPEGAI
jgi:hypothetical protein